MSSANDQTLLFLRSAIESTDKIKTNGPKAEP